MCRVQSGIGRPSVKWMSHSIQPECGAHGSARKVVGSGSISTSAAPSSSFMPKPAPGCQTGNTVRCEVSFKSMVAEKPTPFFSAASISPAANVLPRSTPCWSAKASRTAASLGVELLPVVLPALGRAHAVDRDRPADRGSARRVEPHRRLLAVAHLADRRQQHAAIGDDRLVAVAEMLLRAVLDAALAL